MNKKQQAIKNITYTLLPISIYTILPYPSTLGNVITLINIVVIWWLIIAVVFLIFFSSIKLLSDKADRDLLLTVKLYLFWNFFSLVRGCFIAENYWDWKGLVYNSMGLLLPVIAYIVCKPTVIQALYSYYIKYILPLFIIFIPFISNDAYGYYLMPIGYLLLFLPSLTRNWKIIVLTLTVFVVLADLGARSNVIKFTVPIVFSLIYYLRGILSTSIMESARKLLIILPILLFSLAIADVFNIYKMDDYIHSESSTTKQNEFGESVDEDLKADTRTFIYVEVLETANKYNEWWVGRSPARGYESQWFGDEDDTGRGERRSNEVSILNIFTWSGLIGVVLYCIVFYKASYLAVQHSNNIYIKIVGLFVTFRWLYAWIEDFNVLSLNYMFLWLMIGMCFSKSFRAMTNKEFEYWVQGIFDKRLRAK